MRSLTPYSLSELEEMKMQGFDALPSLDIADRDHMVEIICKINTEIARRASQENLAARVCGYAPDGTMLPAVENHRYAHIARSRR